MKFSSTSLFVALSLSTAVFSAPLHEKRQTSAIDVINNAVSTLQTSVTADESAIGKTLPDISISSAVQESRSDVTATAAITAAINANLQDIVNAFETATTAVDSVTTGAAGGVAGAATGFTQQEIDELTNDIDIVRETVDSIHATVSLFVTNLTPAVQQSLAAEEQNVESSIGPLVQPLEQLAAAVEAAQVNAGGNVTGLQGAIASLINIFDSLLGTII